MNLKKEFSEDLASRQQSPMPYAEMMQKVRRALGDCTEVEMGAVEV
jgi:uncharacterized protein (UPF0128 family)